MSEDYSDIFGKIANAKKISTFAPKLELGRHKVAIKQYKVKASQKGAGPMIEAEFVVLESNVHDVGESRGWCWFISSPGFAGQYQESFAKDFIKVVGQSVGSDANESDLGKMLASADQPATGIVIDVEIRAQTGTKKDGSARVGKDGTPYTDCVWKAVAPEMQDPEGMKAKMAAGIAPVARAATASVPAATAAVAGAGAVGGGILGTLMGKK